MIKRRMIFVKVNRSEEEKDVEMFNKKKNRW